MLNVRAGYSQEVDWMATTYSTITPLRYIKSPLSYQIGPFLTPIVNQTHIITFTYISNITPHLPKSPITNHHVLQPLRPHLGLE